MPDDSFTGQLDTELALWYRIEPHRFCANCMISIFHEPPTCIIQQYSLLYS